MIDVLNPLVEKHPHWGFWLRFDALKLQGKPRNHKRVYKAIGLNLPRRKTRRIPDHPRQSPDAPEKVNHIWSLDFISDASYSSKRFRTFSTIDDAVREVSTMVVDTLIPGGRVFRALEQLADVRGAPEALRADNDPELISQARSTVVNVEVLSFDVFNLANRTRMRTSNASTKHIETKF